MLAWELQNYRRVRLHVALNSLVIKENKVPPTQYLYLFICEHHPAGPITSKYSPTTGEGQQYGWCQYKVPIFDKAYKHIRFCLRSTYLRLNQQKCRMNFFVFVLFDFFSFTFLLLSTVTIRFNFFFFLVLVLFLEELFYRDIFVLN